MIDKRYNPDSLTGQEIQYKTYFDKLVTEFGANYEIWIREDDFGRRLAAGIVNRYLATPIAITIWLKYGSVPISDPLNHTVIEAARYHLISSKTEDLQLNYPEKNQ